MTPRSVAVTLALLAAVGVPDAIHSQSRTQSVFRSTTLSVAVNASVKRGNRVVANLTARDFRLTDVYGKVVHGLLG